MESEIQTWLEGIRQAIDEIEGFLPEKRNLFEFKKDLKTRKAILLANASKSHSCA